MPILQTLKSRREFLNVRGGERASTAAFLMERRIRKDSDAAIAGPRFGLTITKKLGNAVTRNRIRRRLKAAIAARASSLARPDSDYVVVARPAAFDRDFSLLMQDVERALSRLSEEHGARQSKSRRPQPEPQTTRKP